MNETLAFIQEIMNYPLFMLNQNPITLGALFVFFFILFGFAAFGRIVIKKWLSKTLLRFNIEPGTSYTLTRIANYSVLLVGALIAFQFIGIDLSSLMVLFGFLSVGIGFGLQNLTSNFVSGLIILFERPIRVGDRIQINQQEGDVVEINMRSTTIRSQNNISIIVPNSEFISSSVINWSHSDPRVRLDIDVSTSYSSDLDLVFQTLKGIASECQEVLQNPQPEVLFLSFGDSAWNLRLRVWIYDPKRHPYVKSEINCKIVNQFRTHSIEIPFPQRDVHIQPKS